MDNVDVLSFQAPACEHILACSASPGGWNRIAECPGGARMRLIPQSAPGNDITCVTCKTNLGHSNPSRKPVPGKNGTQERAHRHAPLQWIASLLAMTFSAISACSAVKYLFSRLHASSIIFRNFSKRYLESWGPGEASG
jgi:hypothetical protein